MRRGISAERSDDEVSTALERSARNVNVALLILRFGQKVEDGPVVPQIESARGQCGLRDIGLDPRNLTRARSQTGLSPGEGDS